MATASHSQTTGLYTSTYSNKTSNVKAKDKHGLQGMMSSVSESYFMTEKPLN